MPPRLTTIEFLGRAQWIGIALVPAGYLHLANALFALSGAGNLARRYRWTVPTRLWRQQCVAPAGDCSVPI
jgi:hypothetical protein